jgi:hypothetical protein
MRIEAEFLELPIPLSVRITQALDVDTAREASFDRCFDELRSEKRERER